MYLKVIKLWLIKFIEKSEQLKKWDPVVLNFGISISFRKQRFFSSQFVITPIPHPFSIYFENDALTNETMTLTLDLHYFKLSFSSQQPVRKELRTSSNIFYLKFQFIMHFILFMAFYGHWNKISIYFKSVFALFVAHSWARTSILMVVITQSEFFSWNCFLSL